MNYESWIANAPIEVRMAGWRSDTYTLQREGWQLSAAQRMDNMTLQLALKFPGGGHYVTNVVDLYYFKTGQDRMDMLKHLALQVPGDSSHHAVPSSRVILHEGLSVRDFDHFKPIDATPFHMNVEKDHKLEDLVVFRPLPTSEIVIAPATVPQLMDQILELQDPKMKALIEEDRKREARKNLDRPSHKVENHCQIISLAS
jgi:hypothetical protein